MYKIYCPECGKGFTLKYSNDRVYCHCQLPIRLVFVSPYDDKQAKEAIASMEANYVSA